ncbi:MAG: YihA family ribosome biogenesis GTP-binding protein [Clostridiales bacterium]|nr:YihA family ribosome biogenesis GTP-binding protein [Clostridiales bacterium]
MIIKEAKFITSVADKKNFLVSDKPIIAVCGKSNVGKSSIINCLANRKKLARTSVTPGRTRLINYFDFGEFILADLPGYGFAKVSDSEKQKWARLMEDFFAYKEGICHVIMLVDIRHDPTKDDLSMISYLHSYALPFTVVATKADKIGKTKIFERVKSIGNILTIGGQSIIPTSSETGYGKDKLLAKLDTVLEIFNDDFYTEEIEEETEEE